MNVLLFGATGLVGRSVARAAPPAWAMTAPSHAECDIGDEARVHAFVAQVRPTLVINAAAFTGVDAAEDNAREADRVNALAPAYIASACASAGARMVHIGSDYVFDGRSDRPYREDDAANPISAYGLSKLGGENAVLERLPSALVVRTQWVFGPGGRSLVTVMQDRARRGETARVVSDQRGRPTYVVDLARALVDIAARPGVTGLLHIANDGEASSHELASAVYAHYGRAHLVQPVSSAEFGAHAPRPAYSSLALDRLRALGVHPRPWRLALSEFLDAA